jgi:hypothetical protein
VKIFIAVGDSVKHFLPLLPTALTIFNAITDSAYDFLAMTATALKRTK